MRRSGWVVVLTVVGLGLTGCSDPGTPSDTLPTAASTTAEPTLAPLGPADFPVPAEAREQTEAGALAMATYYLDLIDVARSRMDGDDFLALSNGCETCEQLASGFAAERSAGNWYEGGDLRIDAVGATVISGGTADLTLRMIQGPSTLVGPDGAEIPDRSTEETRLSGGMVFNWDPSRQGWIVSQLNAERY